MVSVCNIKRVVSVFILRQKSDGSNDVDVAVFHRCPTMPTFPNHWAGISGSIEEEDCSPMDAAVRELQEETNVCDILRDSNNHKNRNLAGRNSHNQYLQSRMKAGLHLDVSKNTKDSFGGRTIRVYPFAMTLPTHNSNEKAVDGTCFSRLSIEMRGTEHDIMKFVSIKEFLNLAPCVPGLQRAFHHATQGLYLKVRR